MKKIFLGLLIQSTFVYSSDVVDVIHPDEVSLKVQHIDAVKFNIKMDSSRVRVMYYFSKDISNGSFLVHATATLYYWPKSKDGNVDLIFHSKNIGDNKVEYVFPDGERFVSIGLGRLAVGGQYGIDGDVVFPLTCAMNPHAFPGNNMMDLVKGDDSRVESYCLFGIQTVKIDEISDPRFKLENNDINGFTKIIKLYSLNDRLVINKKSNKQENVPESTLPSR